MKEVEEQYDQNCNDEDAKAIRDIYAPYVRDTAITFDYEVPSVEEFQQRIRKTLENYPYFRL